MTKDEQIEKLIELCNKQQQTINDLVYKMQASVIYLPVQEHTPDTISWENKQLYCSNHVINFNPKNITFTN